MPKDVWGGPWDVRGVHRMERGMYVVYTGWNVGCTWCTRDGTWYVRVVRGIVRGVRVIKIKPRTPQTFLRTPRTVRGIYASCPCSCYCPLTPVCDFPTQDMCVMCGYISIEFNADLGLINFIANWDYNILLLCTCGIWNSFNYNLLVTKQNLIM